MARDSAQSLRVREGSGSKKGGPGMLTQADTHRGGRAPRGESPLPTEATGKGIPGEEPRWARKTGPGGATPTPSRPLSLPRLLIYGPTHAEEGQKSGRQSPPPQPATVHQQDETFIRKLACMQTDTEPQSTVDTWMS